MDNLKSQSGLYNFVRQGKEIILEREGEENQVYIFQVASLSFHKAIIGISELKALSKFSSNEIAGGFRLSKAINTYYVIYHLITFCMLMDENYNIKIKKKIVNDIVQFEVDESELNSDDESPERWNKQGDLEKDIASMISHTDIKNYCRFIRSLKNKSKITDLFFENFLKEKNPRLYLYEKVCYVRDRVVYRPTIVIDDIDGMNIQTSADAREEIDQLPDWDKLYEFVISLHDMFISDMLNGDQSVNLFLRYLWVASFIHEDKEQLFSYGWSEADIESYKSNVSYNNLAFDAYLSHIVEILEMKRVKSDYHELWEPLKIKYLDEYNRRLNISG